MSSVRQIEANRRNSQKSTGPKSATGKAASRFNALRHGLTAKHCTISVEDGPEFNQIRDEFLAEHQPTTPTEFFLVEQIVVSAWRLRRLRKTETAFLTAEIERLSEQAEARYTSPSGAERVAHVVDRDSGPCSTLLNLNRYEARLERSFYKALRELQQLKKTAAPPPAPEIGFVCSPAPELESKAPNTKARPEKTKSSTVNPAKLALVPPTVVESVPGGVPGRG
jgi:hypothetical protein